MQCHGAVTAGSGLPWSVAEGCPVGLSSAAQWLGDTPGTESPG